MGNSSSRVPAMGVTKGLLTRRQVAERLGKSLPTVRRMELTGELTPIVEGGIHLFDPKEVEALSPAPPPDSNSRGLDSPGEVTAACFELFEKGRNVTEVCCVLKRTVGEVRALYKEWRAGNVPPIPAPVLDEREQEAVERKWRDEMDRTYSAWEKDLETKWRPGRRSK